MRRRPRILIVKTGEASPYMIARHGDHDRWFVDVLGMPERFSVVDAFTGTPLPAIDAFDGVIVTGSPLSACEPLPWMETVALRLREWAEDRRAILGVCFGHQLLSWAFGAPVIRNPRGREIGTIEVELTEAGRTDPLFEGLGATLQVQATHTDMASTVAPGATLLARNGCTDVQSARYGQRAVGVQFHPEIRADALRSLIGIRREVMAGEGLDGDAIAARVTETSVGPEILRRFEERVVGA